MEVAREDASTAGALIKRKAELLRLADRCEREEPSRMLDYEIELWTQAKTTREALHFTTSLDAAATFAPPGYIWDVTSTGTAWVMDDRNEQEFGKGTRPSLALCAAALRARAQEIA